MARSAFRTQQEHAVHVLKYLENYPNRFASTGRIARGTDVPVNSRDTMVKVMERLVAIGVMEKEPRRGVNAWRLVTSEYDPIDPLATPKKGPGSAVPVPYTDARTTAPQYKVTGDTFPHREALRAWGKFYDFGECPGHPGVKGWVVQAHAQATVEGLGLGLLLLTQDPFRSEADTVPEYRSPFNRTETGKAPVVSSDRAPTAKDEALTGRVTTLEQGVRAQAVTLASHQAALDAHTLAIQDLKDAPKGPVTLEIKRWDGKTKTIKDAVLPECFKRVVQLVSMRRPVLLVGPAGCGKSHLAKMVADALGLDFGSVSCTSGMSETHLLGRGVPNLHTGHNVYQGTEFVRCYEGGGLFLLDELDAADPNLLLSVNTALANGYLTLPNRSDLPVARRHKDFACVATANTFGKGATRQYAGRNQLDEATLDRFRIGTVACGYDPTVEAAVCPDDALRVRLNVIRQRIEACGLRRVLSTRFMQDAYAMTKGADWSHKEVEEAFFEGWSADDKLKVSY